jgi:hypothetical protein
MEPQEPDVDATIRVYVQDIIDRAKIFIARFGGYPFLTDEPIHEFVGLEFRDKETSKLIDQIKFRLILRPTSIGIFSLDEVPLDEMYDIRHVIAEAQLPEFSENKLPSQGP